ncbi:MAG: aspartate/glutamate racemase family protein [Phycisphaerae bacterium]|nr:aspartate/glutamate racemase family protein [Phycisphaerae bacterium]
MAKHIGIVAVSPEGSALCYREIFRRARAVLGDSGHPTVTIHNEPLERYIDAVRRNDWAAVGDMLRRSASILAAAGAEVCILPDNLMQHGVHLAQHGSPIPWLTMTELVADALARDGRRTVGLVGTRLVTYGSTYQTHLGLRGMTVLVPEPSDADAFDAIIFRELVHGQIVPASRAFTLGLLAKLAANGCDSVVLGSSEVPLMLADASSPLPLYDPTVLLSEGALRFSLGHPTMR